MLSLIPIEYRNFILDPERGDALRCEGWGAADLHVHSSCSEDVLCYPEFHPEAVYQRAKRMGLKYITITDHDTMDAYDQIGWQRENLVTGVEMSLFDPKNVGHTIHINVYDLNRWQFKEMMLIAQIDHNIFRFVEFLQDQNLPYVFNHPFWFSAKDKPDYLAVEKIADLFPVIEYNMKRVNLKNLLMLWMAGKHQKGIIATTDTHIAQVGEAYTLSKGETFREYFQNIIDKQSYIIPQDLTLKNLNGEIHTWIELLFSMKEIKGIRTRYTGILPVDEVINYFANVKPDEHPLTFPLMKLFFHNIAKTSIFSFLYLFLQKQTAYRIGKLLRISEPMISKTIPEFQER